MAFWRWFFRSRKKETPQPLGSPYRASSELLPGSPPRPPSPPLVVPRERAMPRPARPGQRSPVLAVFGLITVAARLASVHNEASANAQRFQRPDIEPRFLREPAPQRVFTDETGSMKDATGFHEHASVPAFLRPHVAPNTPSASAAPFQHLSP